MSYSDNYSPDEDISLFILNDKNELINKEFIESMLKKYGVKHKVQDIELYRKALVHVSYVHRDSDYYKKNKIKPYQNSSQSVIEPIENPEDAIQLQDHSYERMEFVGDGCLHFLLADYLFDRYESEQEGFMTRLRTKIENSDTLAKLSKVIGLNKYVLISRHHELNGSRDNNKAILEDAFEAFIAALYRDGGTRGDGFNRCFNFFINLMENEVDFAQILHKETNFKDMLLRYFHQRHFADPEYETLDVSGPDNHKNFTMCVRCRKNKRDDGEIVGIGVSTSKKKGEQEAARQTLIHYGVIKEDDEDSDTCEEFSDLDEDDDDDSQLFICKKCDKEFKNDNQLNRHVKVNCRN